MNSTRLGIVILAVADLAVARRFYETSFGWPLQVEAPVYLEYQLPGGMRFGVYLREAFARNTGQLPDTPVSGALTSTELYLYPDDLPGAIELVIAAGGRLLSALAPRDWGDDAAYVADPDGNVIVLARPSIPS